MLCRLYETGWTPWKALCVPAIGLLNGDLFESRRRAWPQVKVLPPAMACSVWTRRRRCYSNESIVRDVCCGKKFELNSWRRIASALEER